MLRFDKYEVFAVPVFWVALAGTLALALWPHGAQPLSGMWDKNQHMLAFIVLSVLAVPAFPAMPLWRIGERLSFFGALIEVLQSIPALHRNCDIFDWIADSSAIAVTLACVYWMKKRHLTARSAANLSSMTGR